MRSLCCKFLAAVAVLLGVTCPHFAKAQSDPATLEKLVNSPEAQGSPTVPESEDSGPDRPAGTLVRPKDGVQHTDLDKAWAEYHETVSKAADGIKVAIKKQFDVTTAKGDLDAAEKWQAALEKFEKTGEVPLEDETKAAVNATASGYSRAKQGLSKAYEAMTKSLTKEKKITEAKAARAELRMLADTQSSRASVGETTPNRMCRLASENSEQKVKWVSTISRSVCKGKNLQMVSLCMPQNRECQPSPMTCLKVTQGSWQRQP